MVKLHFMTLTHAFMEHKWRVCGFSGEKKSSSWCFVRCRWCDVPDDNLHWALHIYSGFENFGPFLEVSEGVGDFFSSVLIVSRLSVGSTCVLVFSMQQFFQIERYKYCQRLCPLGRVKLIDPSLSKEQPVYHEWRLLQNFQLVTHTTFFFVLKTFNCS